MNRIKLVTYALKWDDAGRVSAKPRFHYSLGGIQPDRIKTRPAIFTVSAPIVLTTRYGVLSYPQGVLLCDKLYDDIVNGSSIVEPANPVLRRANVHVYQRRDGSFSSTLTIKHPILYNSDALDEGIQKLLANYFALVRAKTPDGIIPLQLENGERDLDLAIQLKGAMLGSVCIYLDYIVEMLTSGELSNVRTWSNSLQSFAIDLAYETFLAFINIKFNDSWFAEYKAKFHQLKDKINNLRSF